MTCCKRSEGNVDPAKCEGKTIDAEPQSGIYCEKCELPIVCWLSWEDFRRRAAEILAKDEDTDGDVN